MMPTTLPKNRQAYSKALLGLAAAVILPFLPIGKWIAPGDSIPALLIHEAVWWSYAVLVLLWLSFVEMLPFASIGLHRPTWKTFLYAMLGAAALLFLFVIQSLLIVPMSPECERCDG